MHHFEALTINEIQKRNKDAVKKAKKRGLVEEDLKSLVEDLNSLVERVWKYDCENRTKNKNYSKTWKGAG